MELRDDPISVHAHVHDVRARHPPVQGLSRAHAFTRLLVLFTTHPSIATRAFRVIPAVTSNTRSARSVLEPALIRSLAIAFRRIVTASSVGKVAARAGILVTSDLRASLSDGKVSAEAS